MVFFPWLQFSKMEALRQKDSTFSKYILRAFQVPTIPHLNQSEVGGLRSKLNKLVEKIWRNPIFFHVISATYLLWAQTGNTLQKLEPKNLYFLEVKKFLYNLEQMTSPKHLWIDENQSNKITKNHVQVQNSESANFKRL